MGDLTFPVCSAAKGKPSSVLVQIEQKQTGGMKLDDNKTKNKRTQALFFFFWADLWVMMWSVHCGDASSSGGELLQRNTGSTLFFLTSPLLFFFPLTSTPKIIISKKC